MRTQIAIHISKHDIDFLIRIAMQQFVGISLKTRLYLLVLVAFIPVALIFYIAEEQKAIEREAILQKAMLLAK